jgi:hypothetical protein
LNWLDFILGVSVLALVPFVLTAYGGHVATESINEPTIRRNVKLKFWGLCAVGVVITCLYQYRISTIDAERQRKTEEAQRQALSAQNDLRVNEISNGIEIKSLQKRMEAILSHPQSAQQRLAALNLKEDLASAVAEKLKNVVPKTTAPSVTPTPTPTPLPTPTPKPCRRENLGDCGNEELLAWGATLVSRLQPIADKYYAGLMALDDNKVDSKWLKGYATAQVEATDSFRICCTDDTLRYYKELASRLGGGFDDIGFYDWIGKIQQPEKSRDWKKAREHGGSQFFQGFNSLKSMQSEFDARIKLAKIKTR